jgi:hypothetical protein
VCVCVCVCLWKEEVVWGERVKLYAELNSFTSSKD